MVSGPQRRVRWRFRGHQPVKNLRAPEKQHLRKHLPNQTISNNLLVRVISYFKASENVWI